VRQGSVHVFQSGQAQVSATVTFQVISVSVGIPSGYPTSVDYGPLRPDIEAAPASYSPATYSYLRVVNSGNVAEHFLIKGANATSPGEGTWTLADTPGVNQYVHLYGTEQAPGGYTALSSTDGSNLAANVAVGEGQDFNLKIHTPTGSTVQGQYSTTVTIVALGAN
jgi:hypothetical protein